VRTLIALLFILAHGFAQATAQIPDRILVDGQESQLFAEPLFPYLKQNKDSFGALMKHATQMCSAAWRGYKAKWKIRENQLFLIALFANPCDKDSPEIPLAELFPGATSPIPAKWFSGTLSIPQGKMVEYVHMGYQSKYERYLVLTISDGLVTGRKTEESK
jgi:hypothetical protein